MALEEIQTFIEQGRYEQALQTIENLPEKQKFTGLCDKTLIYCLRGEVKAALPVITQLEQSINAKEDTTAQFIISTLKTFVGSHQGKEPDVYQHFEENQRLSEILTDQERNKIVKWEAWLHFALAMFYQNSELYEKPIMKHLTIALSNMRSLPQTGGIEWILRNIMQFCAMINQPETAEKYRKEIYETLGSKNHLFGQAFCAFVKAGKYWIKGEYEVSIQEFTTALPTFEQQKLYTLILGVYNAIATISYMKGEFERAIEYSEKGIQIMEQQGFYWPYPWNVAMGAYLNKGDTQTALTYTKNRLNLMQELQNHKGILKQLRWNAQIYYIKGEYEEALNWAEKCLPETKKSKNIREQVWVLELIGIIYYQMRKLDQAVKHLQQALTLSYRLQEEFGGEGITTGYVQTNLAELYSMRGDFDKALELMKSSLPLMEKHESSWYMLDFYLTMGTILMKKGDYLQAKTHLQQSLAIHQKYGDIVTSADTLYHLVLVNSELNNLDEAQQYLHQLEELTTKTTNQKLKQQIQLAKGIVYKKSPRAVMKAKAQEIFQEVTKAEKIELDLSVFAMLNFLELLLWEVSSSGHEEVLAEIQEVVLRLDELARQQEAHTVEIEVLLIQSRLELITGNVNQALTVLKRAQDLAEANNLENHQNRIEQQKRGIETELQKWQELAEKNAPLIDRIQQSQVNDYINLALQMVAKGSSQKERIKSSVKD